MKFRALLFVPCLCVLLIGGGCEFGSDPGGGTEGQGISLSGSLVAPSGSPLANVWVKVYAADSATGMSGATPSPAAWAKAVDSVQTNLKGRFTFRRLPKGSYDLTARSYHGDTLFAIFLRNLVLAHNTDLGPHIVPIAHKPATWTTRYEGGEPNLVSVAWGNGRFVSVGFEVDSRETVTLLTSPDGLTWTSQWFPCTDCEGLASVIWAGHQWVAVGPFGLILTSPDGTTWTRRESDPGQDFNTVVWTGSLLVAAGGSTTVDSANVWTSPDGVTWTRGERLYSSKMAWNGNQVISVGGDEGVVSSSPDGVTWTTSHTQPSLNFTSITWAGGQWVAGGFASTLATSTDGIHWITRQSPVTADWHSIIWTGTRLVAAASNGSIISSYDGESWISDLGTHTFYSGFNGVAASPERMVAVGWDANKRIAVILSSP